MGRGVSSPYGAFVAFTENSCDCEENDFCDCFEFALEYYNERASALWPSMGPDEKWIGREDYATLSNNFARFGISEYCGCVAVWLVVREDLEAWEQGLAENWTRQAARKLVDEFATLRKLGTMSNGVSVFQKVA